MPQSGHVPRSEAAKWSVSQASGTTRDFLVSIGMLPSGRTHLQGYVIAAALVLILAAILGIKTSLQAASGSKPFSMESFEKYKEGRRGDEEPHPRDTTEDELPNGDWLEDPT